MTDLPRGWKWATLGEIADVVGGVTKDRTNESRAGLIEVPYLRVANVQRGHLDLTKVSSIRVPLATATRLALAPGDVLLNEGGDRDKLGRGWLWEGQIPGCIHQNHVFRARIRNELVHPKWLAWYANEVAHQWFEVNGKQSVNLASISLSKIRVFPVPLAPPAEQRKIVDILEGHFSRLDAASQQLADTPRRVHAWRQSSVDSIIAAGDAPLRPIGELLREPMRNGYSARVVRDGGVGVRTLTLTAVTRGAFNDAFTKLTAADPKRVAKLWLAPGDILVERSNTPELVGTTAMYDGPSQWAIFPDLMIRLRVDPAIILPTYLTAVLRSERVHRQLRDKAKGLAGSMPKIDQSAIASTAVRVPSLAWQQELVGRLSDIDETRNRLINALDRVARREVVIRHALLSAAFLGRLTSHAFDIDMAGEVASV